MRDKHLVFERLYGALLCLYPKTFRESYGGQMRLAFRDACRAAYRRNGAGGLLALWLSTLLDLLKSAIVERAQQGGISMSKARWIALAGPLTILVGSMWMVASIGSFAFQTGLLGDEALVGILAMPVFLSFIPLLLALIGIRLRFHQSAGVLGRLGLALSVAGCAGVIVFMLAQLLSSDVAPEVGQRLWVSYAAVGCVLSIRIGYMLFGVDALRYRLLPRANLLPLLLGSTVVLSLPLDWFGVPAFLPSQWATPFLHFAITGACWVLLGMAMTGQKREPQPARV